MDRTDSNRYPGAEDGGGMAVRVDGGDAAGKARAGGARR
jgi:hypothetical protein